MSGIKWGTSTLAKPIQQHLFSRFARRDLLFGGIQDRSAIPYANKRIKWLNWSVITLAKPAGYLNLNKVASTNADCLLL